MIKKIFSYFQWSIKTHSDPKQVHNNTQPLKQSTAIHSDLKKYSKIIQSNCNTPKHSTTTLNTPKRTCNVPNRSRETHNDPRRWAITNKILSNDPQVHKKNQQSFKSNHNNPQELKKSITVYHNQKKKRTSYFNLAIQLLYIGFPAFYIVTHTILSHSAFFLRV